MLVELNKRPTFYSILAITSYTLNLLFQVIAFATIDWCHFTLNGRRIKLGLWLACGYYQKSDSWQCSDEVFKDTEFLSVVREWPFGARIFATLSLIVLFLMEFVLISYVCIKRLKRYRKHLSQILYGMSFFVASTSIILLLLIGSEVPSLEEGTIGSSYGLEVICVILTIATSIFIFLDRRKRKRSGKSEKSKSYKFIYTISDDMSTSSRTNYGSSFNPEMNSMHSRTTQESRLTSMDNAAFEKASTTSLGGSVDISYKTDFTASTDLVSYNQEPLRRTSSVSSVESQV
ncbi:hypothetical protein KUTeg_015871 [Tegillarca granosa]|uniref:Uncharacterized protein n=1 Tax=Tegillarca granosa TaxID=220873 RepID=A0ABQ9ELS3_TEGGR|nr:hypothetical protein KUTeg_015871 [Tegillarca granosa]